MFVRNIAILLVIVSIVSAEFHPNFARFIQKRFGSATLHKLTRADLGKHNQGSFGGGPSYRGSHRPIVVVHGLRSMAGSLWNQRKIYASRGLSGERILATSYGPGESLDARVLQETMKCEYVKQVRKMLEATIKYYHSTIDVVGLSMGSPIARKAILGGRCVDTNEYIGKSIANNIITFLSVGGANQGSLLCAIPLPNGVCSNINGLSCTSKFIKDINQNQKLAKHVYSIGSTSDEIIGYYSPCGGKVHMFSGAKEILHTAKSHEQVLFGTIQQQADILKSH